MLALLRKNANASKAASEEFRGAGRQDLADKEDLQVKVMEEYAGGVETLGEEAITGVVRDVIESVKKNGGKVAMGDVLKRVFSPEVLGEKNVEKGEVARIVKGVLAEE